VHFTPHVFVKNLIIDSKNFSNYTVCKKLGGGHGLAPSKDLAVSPLGLPQGLTPNNRGVKTLSDFDVSCRTSRITAVRC